MAIIRNVSIVAISYCWLHEVNPDPLGQHLEVLKKSITLRLKVSGLGRAHNIALFLDYMCLPQHGEAQGGDEAEPQRGEERTAEEDIVFKKGLINVNLWYAL